MPGLVPAIGAWSIPTVARELLRLVCRQCGAEAPLPLQSLFAPALRVIRFDRRHRVAVRTPDRVDGTVERGDSQLSTRRGHGGFRAPHVGTGVVNLERVSREATVGMYVGPR